MTMIRKLKALLFDRAATAGIEFALTAPVIILLFVGGVTVFDIVRSYQKVVEANSVIADLVARQTSIDKAYFDNLYGVFTNLQASATAPKAMRISSIVRTANAYTLAWSKSAGTTTLLPTQKLDSTTLPNIAVGDSIIYIEGTAEMGLLSTIIGFGKITFHETAFTRPRFIAAVGYTGT